MRSLWMEMKYIKSTARLLDRVWANKGGLDLSKEVLWVSVGQRAAELPAVKVGAWKKKSANRPRPHLKQSARVRCLARSNHSQSLMAGNFAALWPTDSKFSALKDLILFSTVSKDQKASSILKVGFSLSRWPHLHRVYLVTVCKRGATAVLRAYSYVGGRSRSLYKDFWLSVWKSRPKTDR